jgi:hypothetical protein
MFFLAFSSYPRFLGGIYVIPITCNSSGNAGILTKKKFKPFREFKIQKESSNLGFWVDFTDKFGGF